ncbi:hypothetical protein [Burkholderia paludis]|uniref:hypothetical protein n=1 Tax=Burkholderia paludis TaxID=1506587 RepID=UPI00137848C5|nr:hypothetical protein [Burkholderia paludis]
MILDLSAAVHARATRRQRIDAAAFRACLAVAVGRDANAKVLEIEGGSGGCAVTIGRIPEANRFAALRAFHR